MKLAAALLLLVLCGERARALDAGIVGCDELDTHELRRLLALEPSEGARRVEIRCDGLLIAVSIDGSVTDVDLHEAPENARERTLALAVGELLAARREQSSEPDETDERETDDDETDERDADERDADERDADERDADERDADERDADERETDHDETDEPDQTPTPPPPIELVVGTGIERFGDGAWAGRATVTFRHRPSLLGWSLAVSGLIGGAQAELSSVRARALLATLAAELGEAPSAFQWRLGLGLQAGVLLLEGRPDPPAIGQIASGPWLAAVAGFHPGVRLESGLLIELQVEAGWMLRGFAGLENGVTTLFSSEGAFFSLSAAIGWSRR